MKYSRKWALQETKIGFSIPVLSKSGAWLGGPGPKISESEHIIS